MSWSDPCSNCGEHRADCNCGHWNKQEVDRNKQENEYFDAHIGTSPNQTVHVRKYHSVTCSSCINSINFKITEEEFKKLENQVHTKTKSAIKEAAEGVIKAWESIGVGHYSTLVIQNWLSKDMKLAIDKLREALKK